MNPTKIRSKTFVLVYKKALDIESLRDFLQKQMKIENECDWNFVIKQEHYLNGETHTIVYCSIEFKPYLPTSKLYFHLNNVQVEPDILVWNNDYLLRYVLTFCGKFDFDRISTNFDNATIIKNVIEIKHCDCNNHEINNTDNAIISVNTNYDSGDLENVIESVIEKSVDNNIKGEIDERNNRMINQEILDTNTKEEEKQKSFDLMEEKQIARFMKHYDSIVTLSKCPVEDSIVNQMKLKLNNMKNFKYTYTLTQDQLNLISNGTAMLKEAKDKLDET